jgi:aspartate/methionine/tyrosine aminotransferase
MTSSEAAEYLLNEAKIAVVPGNVFGRYGEGYLRLSYANSYENVSEGLKRMRSALEK